MTKKLELEIRYLRYLYTGEVAFRKYLLRFLVVLVEHGLGNLIFSSELKVKESPRTRSLSN